MSSNQIFIFSKQWNFRVAFSVCVIFKFKILQLLNLFLDDQYLQASTTGKNNLWAWNYILQ